MLNSLLLQSLCTIRIPVGALYERIYTGAVSSYAA